MVSFSLHCPLTNVFFLSNVKHPSLLWNHDSHSATKKKTSLVLLSLSLSLRNHQTLYPSFFLSLPPSFLSSETTATSTHNKKLLLPISEAKTKDPTCNKESSQNLDLVLNHWGFFFFLGFWILFVWMPRKYSRLKLMYQSVHSEDFGSGMWNFFGNRGLDMVLNQMGFMGILLFFLGDFGFLLFGCQENI